MHGNINHQTEQPGIGGSQLNKAKKPNKKIKHMVIALAVLLIALAGYQINNGLKTEAALNKALSGSSKQTDTNRDCVITGVLSPLHSYNITAKVSGQITEIYAAKGDKVEAGNILIRQDPTDILLTSGQGSTTDELLQRLKMNYEAAADTYEQNKALYDAGAIPKTTLDQMAIQRENARLQYEGTAKYIAEQAGKTVVKSPGGGIITSLTVQTGDYVSAGTTLATITDVSQLVLKGNVLETWLGGIAAGSAVDVRIDSLGKTYRGKITYISPVAVASGQMFPIEITLDNQKQELKAGMSASAELTAGGSQ